MSLIFVIFSIFIQSLVEIKMKNIDKFNFYIFLSIYIFLIYVIEKIKYRLFSFQVILIINGSPSRYKPHTRPVSGYNRVTHSHTSIRLQERVKHSAGAVDFIFQRPTKERGRSMADPYWRRGAPSDRGTFSFP